MDFPDDNDFNAMDVLDIFVFLFFFFIFMSCCCYCCSSKRRGTVLSAPVQVTTATHAVPGGYTVTQLRASATGHQTQSYSTPYPPQAISVPMPMPMPMPTPAVQPNVTQPPAPGIRSDIAPYPTMSAASMNPPPYHVAVTGSATTGVPSRTIYEKQLPYNPNFQM